MVPFIMVADVANKKQVYWMWWLVLFPCSLARISDAIFFAISDTRWPDLVMQYYIYILDISYIFVCRITGAAQVEETTTQGELKHQVFSICLKWSLHIYTFLLCHVPPGFPPVPTAGWNTFPSQRKRKSELLLSLEKVSSQEKSAATVR